VQALQAWRAQRQARARAAMQATTARMNSFLAGFEVLEPRMLLSADLAPVATPAALAQPTSVNRLMTAQVIQVTAVTSASLVINGPGTGSLSLTDTGQYALHLDGTTDATQVSLALVNTSRVTLGSVTVNGSVGRLNNANADLAGQAGDAGADDGGLHGRRPRAIEKCCEAPRDEGGREGGGEESPRDCILGRAARTTSQQQKPVGSGSLPLALMESARAARVPRARAARR
jgi:hypothetical protein